MQDYKYKSQEGSYGISRRDFLTITLGIGALAIAFANRDYLKKIVVDYLAREEEKEVRKKFFYALQLGNTTFLQKRVSGEEMVFWVMKKYAPMGTGRDYLVKSENKDFDNGQIEEVSGLLVQVHDNPQLERLPEGKIETIRYDPHKKLDSLQENTPYKVPKRIKGVNSLEGVKSLEELLK